LVHSVFKAGRGRLPGYRLSFHHARRSKWVGSRAGGWLDWVRSVRFVNQSAGDVWAIGFVSHFLFPWLVIGFVWCGCVLVTGGARRVGLLPSTVFGILGSFGNFVWDAGRRVDLGSFGFMWRRGLRRLDSRNARDPETAI